MCFVFLWRVLFFPPLCVLPLILQGWGVWVRWERITAEMWFTSSTEVWRRPLLHYSSCSSCTGSTTGSEHIQRVGKKYHYSKKRLYVGLVFMLKKRTLLKQGPDVREEKTGLDILVLTVSHLIWVKLQHAYSGLHKSGVIASGAWFALQPALIKRLNISFS